MTKKYLQLLLLLAISITAWSQQKEQKAFHTYLYNNEYEVYMRINFYDQDVTIPGQDLYGPLPGYLGKKYNSFCWVITSCKVNNEEEADLQLINDFGSEDLEAKLIRENDTLYTLRQGRGNTIKIPYKGKWRKLPKTLQLIRKK